MSKYRKLILITFFILSGLSSASLASAATQIFRSVGPSATSALATDSSHANTVTVSSGTATFSSALADNIGVGDAIIVDTGGTDQSIDASDTLLFIHGRTSSTVFTVRTHTGATPSDITSNDTYQIYRAYTSLFNAEAGTKNTSIPITFNGGNRDLVTNDEQWNITCYANGTTADTEVSINGWTTDSDNFIKIYTPVSSSEVGTSQRHNGKWDSNKYNLVSTGQYSVAVVYFPVAVDVIADGLQIYLDNTTYSNRTCFRIDASTSAEVTVSNNIIKNSPSASSLSGTSGIFINSFYNTFEANIYNNIVYDFNGTTNKGMNFSPNAGASGNNYYVYNNTVINSTTGFNQTYGNLYAKNNISQNCTTDYSGTFNSTSTNNIVESGASNGAFGSTADSGTTSGTTASKLVDSTQNFLTTVKVGNIIKNTTDTTYTYVTAVDSDTQLSVANDIFISGEAYTIYTNKFATVSFVDETNKDFHLSQSDTSARQSGANLTADASLPITTDIDGQLRNPSGVGWDIGADEGTVEFTPTVMQTGGDYSTLSSWEAGVQTDLTATTTRVFTHGGITGTIADNSTVTGLTSSATATVVHATTTQILLESISGTFQTGETIQVTSGNNVVISDNGNPASAVAKIDGAWSSADTSVDINGWTTGHNNYIKMYTTSSARHLGKWDSSKYRLSISAQWNQNIFLREDFVIVDGLQIAQLYDGSSGDGEPYPIRILDVNKYNSSFQISNNIIQSHKTYSDSSQLVQISHGFEVRFFNNVITDLYVGINSAIWSNVPNSKRFIYNNTVINSKNVGIYCAYNSNVRGVLYVRNNIVQEGGSTNYTIAGSEYLSDYQTSNNISSDATAPGTNSKINATVSFVSTVSGSEDFHLASTDTAARDAGTSLASDSALPFNTDIDGNTRNASVTQWDIGADEAATQIFRSVGPSATGLLASDSSHANTVTLTSGVATFSAALSNAIGVGDAVIIDTGGTDQSIDASDTLLFISGRTSSTVYTLKTHTGATPSNISVNDTYQIYRAHTSLNNAESGTANTSLSGLGFTFNGGNRDLVANNEEWNISCYANGTTADTTALTIGDWTTAKQNFIKVYTPVSTSEAGSAQRHGGKWDDAKYRLETVSGAIGNNVNYSQIDGLQIKISRAVAGSISAIDKSGTTGTTTTMVSNNIIVGNLSGGATGSGVRITSSLDILLAYSNIFYNFSSSGSMGINNSFRTVYAYNNTFVSCDVGIGNLGVAIAKNNLFKSTTTPASGIFAAGTDYNATDSSSMGYTVTGGGNIHDKVSQTFSFIDLANNDFHLAPTDTAAKNSGVDLSSDIYLNFSNDIDGASRNSSINAWDIGADETATQIYRSVGPSATSSLATDSSHANTVTLTSGVATFSSALADNIGVGDAVIIDTGGTDQTIDASDTLLFISGRNSSTTYNLQTNNGSVPGNISINDTYQIYRAYTSLANAESGTKNTSIPITFNGGDRNLVANNEEWNISCYANGTTADTTSFTIRDWDTGAQNYIKIYTPFIFTEVGASQRHNGKWDNTKYFIESSSNALLTMGVAYVTIDGLQFSSIGRTAITTNTILKSLAAIRISNNIIKNTGGAANNYGILFNYESGVQNYFGYAYNNIVYGFNGSGSLGISTGDSGWYGYFNNNTVYDTNSCYYNGGGTIIAKNNIAQNCIDGFSSSLSGSDYNISDISSDAPSPSYRSGLATDVTFVDETNKDFHLSQTDTSARQSGANLTADASLPIATDIDGQLRNPSGVGWDIGADEGTVEFTPTVMQTGGDYSTLSSWETGVQTDLTATTTRVFTHGGITGTIADNSTVTGLTSSATATVVHATTTQILLENISGTFVTGETVQVTSGNNVVISDNGNPASAVAKIDGSWTVADTSVAVDGWTTGADNYIKIYTTSTARHQGKWDDTKYRITRSATFGGNIYIYEYFIRIDGLQLYNDASGDAYPNILRIPANNSNVMLYISNNILKASWDGINSGYFGSAITHDGANLKGNAFIFNNFIYNIGATPKSFGITLAGYNTYIYNNTIRNFSQGIYHMVPGDGDVIAKNNIVASCSDPYYGSFDTGTDYNATDINDTPGVGSNNKINQTFNFVSTVSGSEDFHLASTDTAARDSGADLSADTYVPFNTDIDGNARNVNITVWDIGADEAATRIFRSVGPSATGLLASDSSHANTVTLTSGVATFSSALADNIGVGDAVIIDIGGTDQSIDASDTLLFISGRTSSTVYTLKTHTGATPSNISVNDTYQIYRAHTSLSNAESGTANTSLSGLGFTFNGGNRDLVANNEEWNISCYANGTTADTTAVSISGWTTGLQNYVKIYTPTNTNEVGSSRRHTGSWSSSKYRFEASVDWGASMYVSDSYVKIEGLQIYNPSASGGFNMYCDPAGNGSIIIASNLIKGGSNNGGYGSIHLVPTGTQSWKIYNNVIYDSVNRGILVTTAGDHRGFIANNTIISTATGIYANGFNFNGLQIKNNIAINNGTDYNLASSTPVTGNNISSDATSPDGVSFRNKTVSFMNYSGKDFHLSQSDTSAKNAGADLSAYLTTDIDGSTRNASINSWDIGADEAATQIFRSVGPGATSALATDGSHANTVTVSSGVATFSAAIPNAIGVGDAVIIDTGGTDQAIDASDTLLFISGRTSSTVYTVKTHTGATPTDITSNDTYSIYRAYTSLGNAESGTKNTSIPITFNGGDRNLVVNNEEWNIACYTNGTTASGGVSFYQWTTASRNFIKAYTPVNSSEVGVSQRHNGKWDNSKFYIQTTGENAISIYQVNDVYIEGLQVSVIASSGYYYGISLGMDINSKSVVSNSIIKGSFSGTGNGAGIFRNWSSSGTTDIYNNIIYGFRNVANTSGTSLDIDGYSVISVYNNTIHGSYFGIDNVGMGAIYKNNIVQGCVDGFKTDSSFNASSDYNISDIVSDAPSSSYRNGLATDVTFTNESNKDLHLSQTDTVVRGVGTNLTSDTYLPITTDVDGQLRNPTGVGWDIGADEGTVEFTPSVMQTGGDYSTLSSWEAGVQTDLVAITTRVFSHGGITGTIADNSTITGLTSSATATVVHTTTTQILLENISGTFATGETVQVTAGNSVVISDNGNPASAVAKIDGSWSSADTSSVTIDGWNLKPNNYIKIYTTATARHKGKWDNSKYRLAPAVDIRPFQMYMPYVKVDGLQIKASGDISETPAIMERGGINDNVYSNNILWGNYVAGSESTGIRCSGATASNATIYVFNNIIHGFASGMHTHSGTSIVAYNNTLYDNIVGLAHLYSGFIAKNNVAYNNGMDYQEVYTAFDPSSSNNLSSDATAPGSKAQINARVDFISTASGSEDFHIKDTSYGAINEGVDLSADINFPFSADIDGNARTGSWDIGADETATQIYRSVAPTMTGLLDSDGTHTKTVTLSSGTATFSAALPDNIGIGDVVLIDTGGTDQSIDSSDTLLFIQKRISSTSYQLQANNGSVPGNISANDTYQIYRAYTSLSNAEDGTKNTSIPITFNGGNRDLVTNNEQWNIACYANGTTADSSSSRILSGWTTGEQNYLKIYTPVNASEVGISQRHSGKPDNTKYLVASSISDGIYIQTNYTKVDGIQISTTGGRGIRVTASGGGKSFLSDNLITVPYDFGIFSAFNNSVAIYAWNNIIYNSSVGVFQYTGNPLSYYYNNTVINSTTGFTGNITNSAVLINNITQNCTNGYEYYDPVSDYNISDLASDAPSASYRSGLATDVTFIDEAGGNFCLSSDDLYAKRAGVNLFSDSYLSFTNDVRGQSRPKSPDAWSIGACEALDASKMKMEGTQIKMEGRVKME